MTSELLCGDTIVISSDSDDSLSPVPCKDHALLDKLLEKEEVERENITENGNNSEDKNQKQLQETSEILQHNCNGDLSVDELFEKFIEVCTPLMKEANNAPSLVKLTRNRHAKASDQFKSSANYRNLLTRFIRKLEGGHKAVFVYVNDIVTVLRQHSKIQTKRSSSDKENGIGSIQTKRVKLTHVSATPSDDGSSTSAQDEVLPGPSSSHSNVHDEKINNKIAYYESLLKKFSDEIKRLQAHELTLDEMGQEDSTYIQEALLKKRIMKIFNKLCAIKKVPVKTGRAIEQTIKITNSRYPEINRKVESYVNKVQKFPDYFDVNYLVKQSNKKHSLQLLPNQISAISRNLFKEVGEKLQHRRHYDFVYNFGCYLTDTAAEKACDPAEKDPQLQERLNENRKKAKSALSDVFDSFAEKQSNDVLPPQSNEDQSNFSEKDNDSGSDPPSEHDEREESDDTGLSDVDSDEIIEIFDEPDEV